MKGVIYCYHCIASGKKYIGKTKNEKIRKRSHRCNVKKGIKNNFYNAIRKYGWENFVYGIIDEFDILLLDEKEIYYIDFYDTYNTGYNSTRGGEGGKGRIMSEEVKNQYRERMKNFKHSDEAKKKISEANSGRKWSDKAKKNLSKKLKGRKGPIISEDGKKRLSEARKGIKRPQYIIDKMVKTKKNNYKPENHPTAKKFIFISPTGEEFLIIGGFKKFCEENNISNWGMRNMLKTGKMVPGCKNWMVKRND
jgi:group I intron endonuclease